MTVQYGWKCPQCNTVHAPTVTFCTKCATGTTISTPGAYSYMGTMSLGGIGWSAPVAGTVFMSHTPPSLSFREQRAEQAIKDWRGGTGSWKELRTLIVRAADEVVEHELGEEEDDE